MGDTANEKTESQEALNDLSEKIVRITCSEIQKQVGELLELLNRDNVTVLELMEEIEGYNPHHELDPKVAPRIFEEVARVKVVMPELEEPTEEGNQE